jgi:large subunit ribosomal protein L6
MSRIGLRPVAVGSGVQVTVGEGQITVKGPKVTLTEPVAPYTRVRVEDGKILVEREAEHKAAKSAHGLMRNLVANMVRGVTEGFTRGLEIQGVGYRAEVRGREVALTIGFSHPVSVKIPDGLDVAMDGQTKLTVRGADKQRVGQFAANLRKIRPPEPYKGKGIRYMDENVRRKVGKSAGAK